MRKAFCAYVGTNGFGSTDFLAAVGLGYLVLIGCPTAAAAAKAETYFA